jgi:hypothetical protein
MPLPISSYRIKTNFADVHAQAVAWIEDLTVHERLWRTIRKQTFRRKKTIASFLFEPILLPACQFFKLTSCNVPKRPPFVDEAPPTKQPYFSDGASKPEVLVKRPLQPLYARGQMPVTAGPRAKNIPII